MSQTFPEKELLSAQSRLEEARRRHAQEVMAAAEAAKDPAGYETYEYHPASAEPGRSVFLARCIGRGHVRKGQPCQDYCAWDEYGSYTLLTDADGVSACKHSDAGSRLACQAVKEVFRDAAQACPDEETFVQNLLRPVFRERVVKRWIALIREELDKREDKPEALIQGLYEYGSTLLFAVAAPHWYVLGNLGDGQAMVFNHKFGIKLRQTQKVSSAVRCLVHETCAREDFVVEAFPRSLFDSVLLSTDGMYDILEPAFHFYSYGRELRHRFLGQRPPEPLQPFCYTEGREPIKDFSRMRTQDDCSIALLLDDRPADTALYDQIDRRVMEEYEGMLPVHLGDAVYGALAERREPDKGWVCSKLFVSTEPCERNLVSLSEEVELLKPERVLELGAWQDKPLRAGIYPRREPATVEEQFYAGRLRANRSAEQNMQILHLYEQISALRRELKEQGLMLSDGAHFLLTADGGRLCVKAEAITALRETDRPSQLDRFFENLIGALQTGSGQLPLFDVGFLTEVPVLPAPGDSADRMPACSVCKESGVKGYCLKNTGEQVWTLPDGTKIAEGETVELVRGLAFCVGDTFEEGAACRCLVKEEL